MKLARLLVASAALAASVGANATLTGQTIASSSGSFVALSTAGLGAGGSIATLAGGTIYTADQPFADIPKGGIFGGNFLAAGPSSGAPATLTFNPTSVVDYISFLWGSPDLYNQLTVTTTLGSKLFTVGATSLNFAVTDGNQSFSQYVQFMTTGGEHLLSLSFNNLPAVDAFETANFALSPIPEPETYALMLAGLGAIGFLARRRKTR